MKTIRIIDKFVMVTPGEPYLLFPFGRVFKGGEEREFTPELAARFQLPHFKPPIKIGTHAEDAPAAGHIVGLEVRADGLYAIPEFNERGTSSLTAGEYRYHSPEVIWDTGVIEDPKTGELNQTPLIWGDALLHTPHLGEATALYTVEEISHKEKRTMTQDVEMVPLSAIERIKALFAPEPQPEPTPEPKQPAAPVDDYAAKYETTKAELEKYKAEVEQMEARQKQAERVAQYAAEFKESPAVAEDAELHQLLAGLPEETAKQLTVKFKALSAQIQESNLTADVGANGEGEGRDAVAMFTAKVDEYRKGNQGTSYTAAVKAVSEAHPELAQEALGNV